MNSRANDEPFDVAVVGYGPVGMAMAALLARAGHRVVVFERYSGLYNLPRAASFDDETMRTLAGLGIAEVLLPNLRVQPTYEWRNAAGQLLIEQTYAEVGRSGWAEWYMMYQPDLETALDEINRAHPDVEIRHATEVVDLADTGAQVTLSVEGPTGRQTLAARYVVACDGGNSTVRDALQIGLDDYGFSEPWMVCDFEISPEISLPNAMQISDPAQPTSVISIGLHHHRFSFMLDSVEDFEFQRAPDRVWRRVGAYLNPDVASLIRVATYTFRSLVAMRWRAGRILLAGDAAHQMPPFLGQGMVSGIRDTQNIAFKLDLVLRGRASAEILDSYQREREPHVRAVIEKGVELGRLQTVRDAETAAQRDRVLLARRAETTPAPTQSTNVMRFPALIEGLLDATRSPGAGDISVHGVVDDGTTRARLDQVVGPGFHLLVGVEQLDALAQSGRLAAAHDAAITVVAFGATPRKDPHAVVVTDVDGTYTRWFAELGSVAVLVRPDYYVFGSAVDGSVARLVDEFLGVLSPADDAASV